ncbi:MAG: efflux RND transporter permease subunit [Myxococcales bacterium]|nr:efflux RND transporter permease subunit [Myxococcales bacterium]
MFLSDVSVRRPVLATVLSALVVSFGVLSLGGLPLREMPDVDPPIVSVTTTYPGASAAVIENRITKPFEDQLNGIEGVRTVESTSTDGSSTITIEFELSRDIEEAANDVRERVARAVEDLPDEADPPEVLKADADASPIMWLNLGSETRDSLELTDYAERYLVDRFAVLDGVARIRLSGERKRAMRIWVDRVALAARRLTVVDLEDALRRENVELPAGRLESQQRDFAVRVERGYGTERDFEQLVVARGPDGYLVRLGEVARVEIGPEEWRTDYRGNGLPRLGLGIVKQSGANTTAVAARVREQVERIAPELPADMDLYVSWDSSEFVQAAVDEVYSTFAIAMLLVVVVIYLFLGTKRAALIPAVTVPICIVGSFTFFFAFGLSLNMLTLLALVLSIGLVVDDSIVVLENVQRRIELGEEPLLAAQRGAREVGFAVIATTLVVIAVFVPIAFLEGATGRLFRELAVTVAATIGLSSLIALTLSVMMCSKLLVAKERDGGLARVANDAIEAMRARYATALRATLRRPAYVGVALAAVLASIAVLFRLVPTELEPFEDRGGFMVVLLGPEGASFDYSVAHMREVEHRILFPLVDQGEVRTAITRVPGFGYGEGMNTGWGIVVMEPWSERELGAQEIMGMISAQGQDIAGVRVFAVSPGGMGRRGSGRDVQFVLRASSHEEASAWQERLLARADEVPGLVAPEGDFKPTRPEVRVVVDRARAADLGVSIADVSRTLETMLGSRQVGTFVERGEEYPVILQALESQRSDPRDLTNLYVRSSRSAELIPLSSVVGLRELADASALRRFDRLSAATIEGSVAPGHTLGEVLDGLAALARDELPSTAQIDYKGVSREFRESSAAAYFTFGLALLIVFLVLSAQFESFVHPFVIMLTVPLAVAGALFGLWLLGGSINIYSQIGMTILIGLAAKNGILVVEFANQLRSAGVAFGEAVVQAAETRLRPILMTGLSTALGALPLLFGGGPGAGGRRAIGVVVVAGVTFATFFTLFVVPAAYAVLARRTQLPDAVARRLEALEIAAEREGLAAE